MLRRSLKDEAAARESVRVAMRDDFTVVDLLAVYGYAALASDEPDFEGGLIRAAAEALGVTAIVTRDAAAYAGSHLKSMSPAEATGLVRRRRAALGGAPWPGSA